MNLINRVKNILKIERAISIPNIYSLVFAALEQQWQVDGIWRALVDIYMNGSELYVVTAVNGLLYKSTLLVSSTSVALGEPVLVEVDYKPVVQSIKTTRQANGKYRWFAFPAATAVLNRSGELDSRELFGNFVKRIEDGQPYPYLSFYHVGEQITLGRADYVQVDDYTLLMSGLWDDTPLAQAVRRAVESTPEYYGTSIGYLYQPGTKQKLQVGEGISIPVYTDGILVECSILAERDAACLYTGAYTEGVSRMNKKAKDELEKIVAGDPALEAQVAELEAHVDSVNISTEGLIRREDEPVAEVVAVEPIVEAAPEPQAVVEIEMDETAMDVLANQVIAGVSANITEQLRVISETNELEMEGLNEVTRKVSEGYVLQIAGLRAEIEVLAKRIAALEKPMAETVKQTIADMPRNIHTQIVYRPTAKHAAEEIEPEMTAEDVAMETLANLKK